ncbi:MAG: HU family DNA-binding protein [Pseudomonadota bacterium]
MVTKKKTTTRKAAAAAPKPPTKSEILAHIAEETGMARKDVNAVFESLQGLMKKNLGRRGPGIFSMPGLMKIKVQTKPATKARKGINPFTGEEQMFKAKPARKTVKIQALKTLKDMV